MRSDVLTLAGVDPNSELDVRRTLAALVQRNRVNVQQLDELSDDGLVQVQVFADGDDDETRQRIERAVSELRHPNIREDAERVQFSPERADAVPAELAALDAAHDGGAVDVDEEQG